MNVLEQLNSSSKPKKYSIQVDVLPEFIEERSSSIDQDYVFAYHVKVENKGEIAAQVIARHWIIKDAHGTVEEIKGLGLIGRQPYLQPGEVFEYTSGCHLMTPKGSMRGKFMCIAEDATLFDAIVLPFELQPSPRGS